MNPIRIRYESEICLISYILYSDSSRVRHENARVRLGSDSDYLCRLGIEVFVVAVFQCYQKILLKHYNFIIVNFKLKNIIIFY